MYKYRLSVFGNSDKVKIYQKKRRVCVHSLQQIKFICHIFSVFSWYTWRIIRLFSLTWDKVDCRYDLIRRSVLNILSLVAFVAGTTWRSSIKTEISLYSSMPPVMMKSVIVWMEGVTSLGKLHLSVWNWTLNFFSLISVSLKCVTNSNF